MTIGQRIKNRRIELGLSVEELADKLGKNRATVYRYESDAIKDLPVSVLENVAKVLNTTPADLMGKTDNTPKFSNIRPITIKKFPLMDGIAAGKPRLMPDGISLYVDATVDIQADYVLKVHGDSMVNARIHDGDIVFIREQPEVENGEIAAVAIGDEATLKRVYWYQNRSLLILRAENPAYKDMEFSGQELEDVRIMGKAVAFQSDLQ